MGMSNVSKRWIPWQWPWILVMTILGVNTLPLVALAQEPVPAKRPLILIKTEFGDMTVALFNETPAHRDRFLALVEAGAYDSLLFHRVVPGFALEGGDPESKHAEAGTLLGQEPDSMGFPLEVVTGLIHKKGALCAAPAGDGPLSAGRSHPTRFYIVQGVPYDKAELDDISARHNRMGSPFPYSDDDRATYRDLGGLPRLDGGHTVFGEVLGGMEVIDAIAQVPCNEWDRPLTDVRMFMRIRK